MPKDNKQKIKLLYLMEILRQDTDEEHPISTSQICKRLAEQGISCERRTVGMDMKVLNDYGYEIMSKMVGHEKAYYIDDRGFSVPEIKILMDAVQAAKFITPGKSVALIEKLAALGGSHQAEILKGNIVCFDTRKHTNEMIFYNVQALEDAIRERKKASFQYFDLNERKEKVYRRDGERYTVDPMALVYNEDFYYLMSFNSKHEAITTYRVDRMERVQIEDEAVCPQAIVEGADIHEYTSQVFKMYNGVTQEITLEFDDVLIGAVYDRFGEDVRITRIGKKKCSVTVTVQDSPVFRGWVHQFEKKMKMVSVKMIEGDSSQC